MQLGGREGERGMEGGGEGGREQGENLDRKRNYGRTEVEGK